jgi:hypothetical protein
MITLEYLAEQKTKYQNKVDYFQKMTYDHLTEDFKGVVDLIGKMEDYMKENEDGKD